MFIPELSAKERLQKQKEAEASFVGNFADNSAFSRLIGFLGSTVFGPLISFFKKNGYAIGLGILCFVLLFKIGEAFYGKNVLGFLR